MCLSSSGAGLLSRRPPQGRDLHHHQVPLLLLVLRRPNGGANKHTYTNTHTRVCARAAQRISSPELYLPIATMAMRNKTRCWPIVLSNRTFDCFCKGNSTPSQLWRWIGRSWPVGRRHAQSRHKIRYRYQTCKEWMPSHTCAHR
jgi:hypothetical protein